MDREIRTYVYTFRFPKNRRTTFTININPITNLIHCRPTNTSFWTALDYHQCQICPLELQNNQFCPVALTIDDLVTTFKKTASYTLCTVVCIAPERTYTKATHVQDGLASILGLLMAVSGCPIMDFFKPLARFHLPFSSVDESIFRIVGLSMLWQHYKKSDLVEPQHLGDIIKSRYALVQQVNKGILERINSISELDADKNAIVTLNSLGQILEMELETNIESLHHLFI
jgi:hypothetical protein